ncbi:hypothetical protein HO133_006768 [Letharia lupina]|uniref:Uncharacterized protein n=1 Tax=Letharia lupina TaxID=560253 RepID=A0A8H6C6P3_9LECA|nr:uncharacterized protein HO133_006768 [Letharia lupina]KAF6217666.1 hypothetical protein HO133_006768 [Letharia lupina]
MNVDNNKHTLGTGSTNNHMPGNGGGSNHMRGNGCGKKVERSRKCTQCGSTNHTGASCPVRRPAALAAGVLELGARMLGVPVRAKDVAEARRAKKEQRRRNNKFASGRGQRQLLWS